MLFFVWCSWNDFFLFVCLFVCSFACLLACLLFCFYKGRHFEGMLKAVRARDFEGRAVEEQALGRTIHPGVKDLYHESRTGRIFLHHSLPSFCKSINQIF